MPIESAAPKTQAEKDQLELFLGRELEKARAKAMPISRSTLSRRLQQEFGIHHREADQIVDEFCGEKEPGLPEFLSSEFGTPYLKVIAILNVLISISLLVMAVRKTKPGDVAWLGFGLAAAFLALAFVAWVNSLRPPGAPKKSSGFRRY